MNWISIGIVAGSLVFGQHDTKEACMGRVETLKEQKIPAKCTEAPSNTSNYTASGGGGIQFCQFGNCR